MGKMRIIVRRYLLLPGVGILSNGGPTAPARKRRRLRLSNSCLNWRPANKATEDDERKRRCMEPAYMQLDPAGLSSG